jgi:hypothetical protein
LGCDGHTVNHTMPAHGRLLVDDPERIGPIQAIGMDQTLFNRAGEYRTQQCATTFADMAGHRLRDTTEGRDTESVITWLQQRPRSWLQAIEVGAWATPCATGAGRSWPGTPPQPATDPPKARTT